MTATRLAEPLRLSILYGASFAVIGVYMPFFPVWLESRGLDPATIGLVLSLPIVTRVLVTAPLMSLVDRGLAPRRLLRATGVCLTLAYAALFFAATPPVIAVLVIAMAVAQAPLTPLCDLVATDAVRADPRLNYGRIRLWGSIAFLVASVAGGYVVGASAPDAVIALLTGLALATLLVIPLAVPRSPGIRVGAAGPEESRTAGRLPAGLWLLIAAAGCVQASHAGVYAFGSLHWREQGIADSVIGALWAAGVVAEIVLFAVAGRVVGRDGTGLGLVIAGAGAAVLRFSMMAFEPGPIATFGLQALHGLSFGATHLGAMAALSHLAPSGARGRAQGLLSTAVSLGIAAGTVVSGPVFRVAGAGVFALMAPIAAVGLVLALLALRALSAHPQRAGEGG